MAMAAMRRQGNYLRVRGEYGAVAQTGSAYAELPPRARRIHMMDMDEFRANGTTSACAENTSTTRPLVGFGRNYLRVRGEYGGYLSML